MKSSFRHKNRLQIRLETISVTERDVAASVAKIVSKCGLETISATERDDAASVAKIVKSSPNVV